MYLTMRGTICRGCKARDCFNTDMFDVISLQKADSIHIGQPLLFSIHFSLRRLFLSEIFRNS